EPDPDNPGKTRAKRNANAQIIGPNPLSKTYRPQPVDGRFLVRPDGTIGLGIYGSVQVAGLTIDQARERVRAFLAEVTKDRGDAIQVVVDVIAFNSKSYYIITDGAGNGAQLY